MIDLLNFTIHNEQDAISFLTQDGKQLWEYPMERFTYRYRKDGMAEYATDDEFFADTVIEPFELLNSCFENGKHGVLCCSCHSYYCSRIDVDNTYVYAIDDSVFWITTHEENGDRILRFDKFRYVKTVKRLITELYRNPFERRDIVCNYWYPRGQQLENMFKRAQLLDFFNI